MIILNFSPSDYHNHVHHHADVKKLLQIMTMTDNMDDFDDDLFKPLYVRYCVAGARTALSTFFKISDLYSFHPPV